MMKKSNRFGCFEPKISRRQIKSSCLGLFLDVILVRKQKKLLATIKINPIELNNAGCRNGSIFYHTSKFDPEMGHCYCVEEAPMTRENDDFFDFRSICAGPTCQAFSLSQFSLNGDQRLLM